MSITEKRIKDYMVTETMGYTFFIPNIELSSNNTPETALVSTILAGYGVESTITQFTSLKPLSQVADEVGLQTEHCWLPYAALWSQLDTMVPATLITRTGYWLLWNQLGPFTQLATPPTGRRWWLSSQLQAEFANQTTPLSPEIWYNVAQTPRYAQYRHDNLAALGLSPEKITSLITTATEHAEGWRGLATLDATTQLVHRLVKTHLIQEGDEALSHLQTIYHQALIDPTLIPAADWSVLEDKDSDEATLQFRGVEILSIKGYHPSALKPDLSHVRLGEALKTTPSQTPTLQPLNTPPLPELWRDWVANNQLIQLFTQDGLFNPLLLGFALMMSTIGVVFQAFLFRSLLNLGHLLTTIAERIQMMGLLLGFVTTLLVLEWFTDNLLSGIGRRLDVRLRMELLTRLPRVQQAYFKNFSTADLMERIHIVRDLHNLPQWGGKLIQYLFLLMTTFVGITLIDPWSMPFALLKLLITLAVLLIGVELLPRPNLQQRTHLGDLSRFYLDGMAGLVAVRVHHADRAIRRAYESHLVVWARSRLQLSHTEFALMMGEQLLSAVVMGGLLLSVIGRGSDLSHLSLLLFWLLQMSIVSTQLLLTSFRYMGEHTKQERFFDLLASVDELSETAEPPTPTTSSAHGMTLHLKGVSFQQDEQTILADINLTIESGSQIAIVGASGAGKSSLLRLLMGWQRPTHGEILIDGQPLQTGMLGEAIAWLDPTAQLWNRSLLYNLQYGQPHSSLEKIINKVNLRDVLSRLPQGLKTSLGEDGRQISMGQGQRVRLGRAMQRPHARLVVFDEPFRGLDRQERYDLLHQARKDWEQATFVCVTHDVGHTLGFDRVLVMEDGHIVEDGLPSSLVAQANSRYRALLEAEEQTQQNLWQGQAIPWRRIRIENGGLVEKSTTTSRYRPIPTRSSLIPDSTEAFTDESFATLSWSTEQLPQALFTLAQKAGYLPHDDVPVIPKLGDPRPITLTEQLTQLTEQLGLETEAVHTHYGDIDQFLGHGAPALLRLKSGQLLLLLKANRWWVSLITPTSTIHRIRTKSLVELLRQPLHSAQTPLLEPLLSHIEPEQRSPFRQQLLQEHLHRREIGDIWLLRLSPQRPLKTHLQHTTMPWYFLLAAGSEIINGLLYLLIFVMFGIAIDSGEQVWLMAALLMVMSRAPLELLRFIGEILFSLKLETLLKRRLFQGILALNPDDIQQHGTGHFFGWLIETERFTNVGRSLSLIIGYGGSLLLTTIFLTFGAGGLLHGVLLGLWLLLTALLSGLTYRTYMAQHTSYLDMNRDLLERLRGHQTRLIQEDREQWSVEEDEALARYLNLSRVDDHTRTTLMVVTTYGWLVVGLSGVMTAFVYRTTHDVALSISFLGVLWAFQQLQLLLPNILDLIRAWGAWKALQPLQTENLRLAEPPPPLLTERAPTAQTTMLALQDVSFHYPHHAKPLLTECNLDIQYGDCILLEGATGVGKSTLAAMLAGLRQPDNGLLLLQGLDQHTLPLDVWRKQVALVPQFHENHVFQATFAFNLLMGRQWPPTSDDLREAEAVCYEVGLGDLLERMSCGLNELLGDSGWQLSQGERGRLYVARALLQRANLIVLDESLASLDGGTMQSSLHAVLKRAPALVVVAHP